MSQELTIILWGIPILIVAVFISFAISMVIESLRDDTKEALGDAFGYIFLGFVILIPIFFIGSLLSDGSDSYDGSDLEDDNYYDDEYEEPGVHWVDDYERSDGTEVDGHWRSDPDEYESNNLNP